MSKTDSWVNIFWLYNWVSSVFIINLKPTTSALIAISFFILVFNFSTIILLTYFRFRLKPRVAPSLWIRLGELKLKYKLIYSALNLRILASLCLQAYIFLIYLQIIIGDLVIKDLLINNNTFLIIIALIIYLWEILSIRLEDKIIKRYYNI